MLDRSLKRRREVTNFLKRRLDLWKPFRCLGLTGFGLAFVVPLHHAEAREGNFTASAKASVTILKPLSVINISNLDFGEIVVAEDRDGAIEIDPLSGEIRFSGGARAETSANGGATSGPARFAIQGQPERVYHLAITSMTSAQRVDGKGPALTVENIRVASISMKIEGLTGKLNSVGRDEVRVGGKLSLPAGTPEGHYSAEVSIMAFYP